MSSWKVDIILFPRTSQNHTVQISPVLFKLPFSRCSSLPRCRFALFCAFQTWSKACWSSVAVFPSPSQADQPPPESCSPSVAVFWLQDQATDSLLSLLNFPNRRSFMLLRTMPGAADWPQRGCEHTPQIVGMLISAFSSSQPRGGKCSEWKWDPPVPLPLLKWPLLVNFN